MLMRSLSFSLLTFMAVLAPLDTTAQQFEKNSASDIFGSNGPKVPMYGSDKPRGAQAAEEGSITNPHAGRLEFLEALCDQLGPKSTVCAELETLRNGGGNSGTRHLGFERNEAEDEELSEEEDETESEE